MEITHVAFADESSHNVGQYRSISLVSLSAGYSSDIHAALAKQLIESDVTELKWKEVKSAKKRFAALKLVDLAIALSTSRQIRIDTLIWNVEDERHKVQGRDDVANLQRMYYHLLRNVLIRRWPSETVWALYPDENSAIDWNLLEDILKKKRYSVETPDFTEPGLYRLRADYHVMRIQEVESINPIVQLADLFAGAAVFSYQHRQTFMSWLFQNSPQIAMFPMDGTKAFTRKDVEHSNVVKHLFQQAQRRNLGLEFRSDGGLYTRNPNNPINFWPYEPQHQYDKAPTRLPKAMF